MDANPATTITSPGIYVDFDESAYFADPCPRPSLTQSLAKILLDRSPAHARLAHPRLGPVADDDTAEKYDPAKAIGNAAHKLMLGRGRDLAVAAYDSWRSDKAKEERAAAEAAGRIPILKKHMDRAIAMSAAAFVQLGAAGFPDAFGSPGEVMLAWSEDNLWFRSLVDWIEPDLRVVWDFKTTGLSVAPHMIPKMMCDADWPVQAAMIERGLNTLDPQCAGRRRFRFVAQENEPPYALTICELPESTMTMGRKKLDMAVTIWSRCMRTGQWPAYPSDIVFPEMPAWRETQWLDREIAFDLVMSSKPNSAVAADHMMGG